MGHPNEDLVRRGYDAFSSGDVETLRELWDPDIVWHAFGRPDRRPHPLHGLEPSAVLSAFSKAVRLRNAAGMG